MKAALGSGPNGSTSVRAEIRPVQTSEDRGFQDFARAVLQLTEQVYKQGGLETMRTFMTLNMLNGAS